jgi:hypothetical protein
LPAALLLSLILFGLFRFASSPRPLSRAGVENTGNNNNNKLVRGKEIGIKLLAGVELRRSLVCVGVQAQHAKCLARPARQRHSNQRKSESERKRTTSATTITCTLIARRGRPAAARVRPAASKSLAHGVREPQTHTGPPESGANNYHSTRPVVAGRSGPRASLTSFSDCRPSCCGCGCCRRRFCV